MFRLIAGGFALTILALASSAPVAAEDKDKVTTWLREAEGFDLKLEVGKDSIKFHVMQGDNGAIVTTKKTVKDDIVMLEVTEVEEKGNFPPKPQKGLKLSFKWVVKGDTATLSDLKGEGLENAKPVLEGEYKLKK